jgi:hypothetical protein
MLHVLQQARNAAKQRSIGGLALASPAVLLLLLELGVCCAVNAALLIFYLLGVVQPIAWCHGYPSKSKGAHDGTYARDEKRY